MRAPRYVWYIAWFVLCSVLACTCVIVARADWAAGTDHGLLALVAGSVALAAAGALMLRQLSGRMRGFDAHLEQLLESRASELISANERLQVEISERRSAEEVMSRTADALEEANRVLKDNQATMVQSEKMASIGQIAAGVAHEINNPTGFVMSNLGTLRTYVGGIKKVFSAHDRLAAACRAEAARDGAHRHDELLGEIDRVCREEDIEYVLEDIEALVTESLEGTERVKEIVQNLKSFARPDERTAHEADINAGIESTLKLVWNELKYNCTVTKRLGTLPRLRCYPRQLNQVFMNLLMNAGQAIDEHGEITVETGVEGEDMVVRIRDSGRGISPELLPRLFDPFFTTKGTGTGTGLGLSISQGIVQKHGGVIEVESEVGAGTTFTVRLPLRGVPDESRVNFVC